MTLVGGFFYFLFRMIGIARKPNAIFTILIILFYSVMAGGMPPVVRATLMGIFILGSILLEQDSESWHVLIAAFLLILAASPGALFSLSFQLSFLSMGVLILFSQPGGRDPVESGHKFFEMTWKDKIRNWIHGTVRTSYLIIVLLLPVFASYFHLSSLSGAIANTMAIPASLWVMILSLIAIFTSFVSWPLAVWAANIASHLFSLLFWILSKISGISFFNWHLATPPLFAVFIYYAVLGIFYWHPYLKRAKSVLITAAVFIFLTTFSYGTPQGITFFDTGHSDAVLVKLSGKRHLLINAGRRLSESRLNWVIEPSLLSSGTRKIWVLPDDRRGRVDQETMRYLAQNFSPAIFDAGKFSEIEPSWQRNGKLAACRMTSSAMRALVIFRTSENLIQDLRREAAGGFDIIYISGEGEKGLDGRLISFLAISEAKHIIFNDRKLLSGFLNHLTGLGRSRLHFLSDSGAVSLSRIVR